MSSIAQIPDWLRITKVGEQHYQVTDISVDSIGLCLGAFHSRQAAQNFANKIAAIRSEARTANARHTLTLRPGAQTQPSQHVGM